MPALGGGRNASARRDPTPSLLPLWATGLIVATVALAACHDERTVAGGDAGVSLMVPPCAPLPPITEPVRRQGRQLFLAGQRYRLLGANTYYLQQQFAYGAAGNADAAAQATQALDDLVCLSMPVARAMAFNDSQDTAAIRQQPGTYREPGLQALDRVVAEAKRRGLRLILALTNNWPEYGGLDAYAQWAGKSHDDFFSDATMQQYWKDYASVLLARVNTLTGVAYKDEPSILGWEIANELRCATCRGTTRLADTVRELAAHLKAAGATQLVFDGGEGFDDTPAAYPGLSTQYPVDGEEGASFSQLAAIPELDGLSYHLYPETWGLDQADVDVWIDGHERIAGAAGKLSYLGEFGSDPMAADEAHDDETRAPRYDAWLDRLFTRDDGSAALLWQLIPPQRRPSADDGYGVVYPADQRTSAVLYGWVRRLAD